MRTPRLPGSVTGGTDGIGRMWCIGPKGKTGDISEELLAGMKQGRYDLICFTQGTNREYGELFRTEKMFWVAAQGAPIVYVLLSCFYERRMDRLDRRRRGDDDV